MAEHLPKKIAADALAPRIEAVLEAQRARGALWVAWLRVGLCVAVLGLQLLLINSEIESVRGAAVWGKVAFLAAALPVLTIAYLIPRWRSRLWYALPLVDLPLLLGNLWLLMG